MKTQQQFTYKYWSSTHIQGGANFGNTKIQQKTLKKKTNHSRLPHPLFFFTGRHSSSPKQPPVQHLLYPEKPSPSSPFSLQERNPPEQPSPFSPRRTSHNSSSSAASPSTDLPSTTSPPKSQTQRLLTSLQSATKPTVAFTATMNSRLQHFLPSATAPVSTIVDPDQPEQQQAATNLLLQPTTDSSPYNRRPFKAEEKTKPTTNWPGVKSKMERRSRSITERKIKTDCLCAFCPCCRRR